MQTAQDVVNHVLSSPDADAVGGAATYCVGCGTCAYLDPAFRIIRNLDGCNQAVLQGDAKNWGQVRQVCPFASTINEDDPGQELFGNQEGVKHNPYLGWFLDTYVGYVQANGWRSRGSSGGFVSWIAAAMLQDGMVDAVIHAKDGPDPDHMYTYQISQTVDELKMGAKSKSYPVEMSEVLSYVREHEGRYLFIGIPCFVKAVRLLCREDETLGERIRYCVDLVCGHLKSDFFAKSEAWEAGAPLDRIKRVDFRHKTPGTPVSDYAIQADRTDGQPSVIKRTAELSTTNWGLGYFKYNACDYCDDVLAETADVTFGDAWLPQYVNDGEGCNVVVVRNKDIRELIERHRDKLILHDSTPEEIYQSQAGGFRHRRQGLQYRLYVHEQRGEWVPTKRVHPTLDGISERRQKTYAMRTVLKNQSFVAYRKAAASNDFAEFTAHMKPYERRYQRITPMHKRMLRFIKRVAKHILPETLIQAMKKFIRRGAIALRPSIAVPLLTLRRGLFVTGFSGERPRRLYIGSKATRFALAV